MKRDVSILVVYSAVLLLSEILYRTVFHITPLYRIYESFFINFVVLSLFYFSKYRMSRFFIACFFAMSIIINNVHYEVYLNWINGTNYLLMIKEWREVTHSGMAMAGKVSSGIIWGFLELIIFLSIGRFRKKTYLAADLIFALAMIYIFVRSFDTNQTLGITSNPGYSRIKQNYYSFGYFVGRILPYDLFELSNVPVYYAESPKIISKPKVKNIIFIVGESATSKHCSVFGYPRQTTPFLEELSEKYSHITLKPAYSAGLGTAISLPAFFSAVPYPNGMEQIVSGRTNLFKLAKEQGYQTRFYSAQPENQMMIISIMGKTWIDDLLFPTNLGYCVSDLMNDHKLLPLFEKINLDQGRNFIVLHQRGSHSPYAEALTENEKIFKQDTPLDKYDSTIYHTDCFIKKVFTHLQKRKKDDWVLLYTSDHGQFVTNESYRQGTAEEPNYLVPLLIYSPNKTVEKLQETFVSCERMFHQQLATFIMHLLGYDMPVSDCKKGTVNSLILTGDSGYLQIEANKEPVFVYPKKP